MEQIKINKKQGSIVAALKEAILNGAIEGGQELTQKEIAESLEVSRMPVREALIVLEYQGLIERLPNNHVRVTELDLDFYRNILVLCQQIEFQVLEKKLDFPDDIVSELFFHRNLYQRCKNQMLSKTLESIVEIYLEHILKHVPPGWDGEKRILEIKEAAMTENTAGLWEKLGQYFKKLMTCVEEGGLKC